MKLSKKNKIIGGILGTSAIVTALAVFIYETCSKLKNKFVQFSGDNSNSLNEIQETCKPKKKYLEKLDILKLIDESHMTKFINECDFKFSYDCLNQVNINKNYNLKSHELYKILDYFED